MRLAPLLLALAITAPAHAASRETRIPDAALRAQAGGKALRTIRVLMAGAEETGLWGSAAYSKAHIDEPIAVGLESDFGADRIWRFDSNFRTSNPELLMRFPAIFSL